MDAVLAEWLEPVPHAWDYWRYGRDDDDMGQWYGRDAATAFLNSLDWLREAEQFDSTHFHDKCFNAIFANWKRAYWTVEQATALTFGKEPTLVTSAYVIQECVGPSIFAHYYKLLRDRILKAQADGRLQELIRPRVYIEWANENRIPFPDELEAEAVPEQDSTVDDYKWLYRLAIEDNTRLRKEIRRLESELRESRYVAAESHPDTLIPLRTGAPGRPTTMQLVLAKHKERLNLGDGETSVRAEADFLERWVQVDYPGYPNPGRKAIENKIRHEHKAWKTTTPK